MQHAAGRRHRRRPARLPPADELREWKAAAGAQEARLERPRSTSATRPGHASRSTPRPGWSRDAAFAADSGGFVPSTAPALSGPSRRRSWTRTTMCSGSARSLLAAAGPSSLQHLVGNAAEWVCGTGPGPRLASRAAQTPASFSGPSTRRADRRHRRFGALIPTSMHQRQPVLLAEGARGTPMWDSACVQRRRRQRPDRCSAGGQILTPLPRNDPEAQQQATAFNGRVHRCPPHHLARRPGPY